MQAQTTLTSSRIMFNIQLLLALITLTPFLQAQDDSHIDLYYKAIRLEHFVTTLKKETRVPDVMVNASYIFMDFSSFNKYSQVYIDEILERNEIEVSLDNLTKRIQHQFYILTTLSANLNKILVRRSQDLNYVTLASTLMASSAILDTVMTLGLLLGHLEGKNATISYSQENGFLQGEMVGSDPCRGDMCFPCLGLQCKKPDS
ncbi:hypothetical protein BgiMline_019318 [Biomphalaria glabrata]|nr:hypothetical protein BgiMline_032189 [Biomphalaria glabrata]